MDYHAHRTPLAAHRDAKGVIRTNPQDQVPDAKASSIPAQGNALGKCHAK
jgi:hypothetical protein